MIRFDDNNILLGLVVNMCRLAFFGLSNVFSCVLCSACGDAALQSVAMRTQQSVPRNKRASRMLVRSRLHRQPSCMQTGMCSELRVWSERGVQQPEM